jgi:hypothetical protein
MRPFLLVLALAACSKHDEPMTTDAPTPVPDVMTSDAQDAFCSASVGTATVMSSHQNATSTWTRLDAGGTWFTGPLTVASPPMSLSLLFVNADPIEREVGWCCQSPGQACCTIDGFGVTTDGLPSGAELGAHAAMVMSFHDSAFQLSGSIDVTSFSQPFEHMPGHIAGSVSASSGGYSFSGTFDNEFCAALLSETI